jgi:hypothetical protein
VQSELLLIAREVIDIFFLILGLSSLSVIVAGEVRLHTFGCEHTPFPQIALSAILLLSVCFGFWVNQMYVSAFQNK